jgi:predicted transcriptional regulator
VRNWSFVTNHGLALMCIAHDPGVRLRDIATNLGITERSANSIVADLTEGGFVTKTKEGRRNRYQIQERMTVRGPIGKDHDIGEVLDLLTGPPSRPKAKSNKS